jgi:AraC family ethanolamine operon transcriptional activator
MAHPPDGFALDRTFDDLDDVATAVPGWQLRFTRLSGGPLRATLRIAATAELRITRFAVDGPILATGAIPDGSSGVALILASAGDVRSHGRVLDTATMAPGRIREQDIHLMTAGATELVAIAADHDLFERSLRAFTDFDSRSLHAGWCLHTAPGAAGCVDRGHAILALQSVLAQGPVFSPGARHRLQECVLQILLSDLRDGPVAEPPAAAPVRQRVARAAEEVLRARLHQPPSLCELCELVGASERTLHHAFQESFGATPKAYLRALRLSAARRRLREGCGSVTEVATDLGLFHFGRFATEYRAMFGEAPSTTLRNARVRRCGRAERPRAEAVAGRRHRLSSMAEPDRDISGIQRCRPT